MKNTAIYLGLLLTILPVLHTDSFYFQFAQHAKYDLQAESCNVQNDQPDVKSKIKKIEPEQSVGSTWISTIQKNISESEYFISWQDDKQCFESPNRKNNLRIAYSNEGFIVKPREINDAVDWSSEFKIAGLFRDERLITNFKKEYVTIVNENILQYKFQDSIAIEYVNSTEGARQNIYISDKPAGEGLLKFKMNISTDLQLHLNSSNSLQFGAENFYYTDLHVWDQNHNQINAWFELNEDEYSPELAIVVDDANAIYPLVIDPLSVAPNKSFEYDQAYASFGKSISEEGDINGDGFIDLIIGAPKYDNGSTDEGRIFIYHGSASGFNSTPTATIEQNISNMQFGYSVCYAGDVNNDGFDDVLVGAPYFTSGQTSEGAAYLFMGTASGISPTYAWTYESDQANAYYGYTVAGLNLINNDGYADFAIGAYSFDNGQSNEGKVFVYYGETGVIATAPDWTYESNIANAYLGEDLSNAGDINDDGYDDLIIGAYNLTNDLTSEGKVYVFHGSASGFSATPQWTAEGNIASAYFGSSVNDAGDLNSDGYGDIVIGAYYQTTDISHAGKAYVYYGSSTGLPSIASWVNEGLTPSGYYGYTCNSAGDLNADGYDDLIVGEPNYSGSYTEEGAVYIYLGSSAGLANSAQNIIYGRQLNARIGKTLSHVGDVNNDEFDDLVLGCYEYDNPSSDEGTVNIYYGQFGGVGTFTFFPQLNQIDAGFGTQVTELINTYSTYIAVSAPYFDNGNINEGLVNVYGYSKTSGVNPVPVFSIEGGQDNANLGISMVTTGDLTGDGIQEIAVSAPKYDGGQTDEGIVYLYDIASEVLQWSYESNQTGAEIGISLSADGDANHDGYDDLLIGSVNYDGLVADGGAILLFYGNGIAISTSPDAIINGDQSAAQFSYSCAFAGDVNADNYDDLIVGAPAYDNGQIDEGRVYIFFSSPEGFYTIDPYYYETNQAFSSLGKSVCGNININNDEFSDVAVGAPDYDNGELNEGSVYLFSGNATGLNFNQQFELNQSNAGFGSAICSVSDLNMDHSDEIIMNAPYYDDGQTDEGGVFIYMSAGLNIYPDSNRISITVNQSNANYGEFIKTCASLDDDDYNDLLIGCPNMEENETNEGIVFIYFNTGLLTDDSDDSYPVFTSNTESTFGSTLIGDCDINGDGFEDLIIGVSGFDNGQTDEGKLMIYFGGPDGIDQIADQQIERNYAGFGFGAIMDNAGDVNADGYDDIVVGYPNFASPQNSEGVVELYLGSAAGLNSTYYRQYQGNAVSRYYGAKVMGAGDINGDGIDDFVAGCSTGTTIGYSNGQSNEGAILVFYGSAISISTTPDLIVESNLGNYVLGRALASGDVNGDGYSDVLATGFTADVFLYYGSAAGLNPVYAWTYHSPLNAKFAETIEISPDVNGDGYGDIFIGARWEDHGVAQDEGAVYGFYGTATIPSSTQNWKVWGGLEGYAVGDAASIYFGQFLEGKMDFNNDGYFDLAVSASKSDLDQLPVCCESVDEGEIRIYFGSELGIKENYTVRIEGKIEDAELGTALTSLGDINNDGYSDFVTSANGLATNYIYFFYGYEFNTQPLNELPLSAEQFQSGFGKQFESAGDVNGDGYGDFMITAPDFDAVSTDLGKVYIYHGSANGIHTLPDYVLYASDLFILSAWPAGDLNNDGFSDIIVQTPGSVTGPGNICFCYYGSSIGLRASDTSRFYVDDPVERGVIFSKPADFNNDGYTDIAVSNPLPEFTYTGNMQVFPGSNTGLPLENSKKFREGTNEAFSASAAVADINGDGFSDIIAGSPYKNYGDITFHTPKVYLYYGSASGIDTIAAWTFTAPTGDYYATKINNIGDLNGDGYADILIHKLVSSFDLYKADIFYGSSTGFSPVPDWSYFTGMVDDKITGEFTPAGDLNNDGYADLVLPCAAAQKIYIFYGKATGMSDIPDTFIPSPLPVKPESNFYPNENYYTTKITIAGDLNGDGYSELAITNDYDIGAGIFYDDYYDRVIYIIDSKPQNEISENHTIYESNQANAQLGYSVSDAGDLNGDGINDMIAGAPFYDNGQTNEGKIFVFYGSNSGVSLIPDWSAEINKSNANFGISVARAGDVNGDGYGDIIAGASKLSNAESQEGGAFIYYGSPSGLSATPTTIESNQAKANLGISVSGAGDINRDGYSDIIIGAEKFDNGLQDEGVVYVHYGSATGINPIPNVMLENNKKKSSFGHCVAGAGDLNGDGYADILISADKYSGGQTQEGKAYVYLGGPSGINISPSWSYESNQAASSFGCSVSTAGDLNGDAFADIMIGAFNYDNGQTDEGACFVFYGSAGGISTTPNWIGESGKSLSNYGYSVSGGGDFNSDGYSDIVIGAPFYDNGENNEGKIYIYFGSPEGLSINMGWSDEGNMINKQLGFSVNNRCDLNADSYSDILCGSNLFSGPTLSEGITEIYFGNGEDNLMNNIALFNSDLITPVSKINLPQPDFGFHFYRIDAEGKGYSKAVWEIKNEGIPFSTSESGSLKNSLGFTDEQILFTAVDSAGSYFFGTADKTGNINKIRLRQKYDLVSSFDGRMYGPWKYYGSPVMVGPVPGLKESDVETTVPENIGLKIFPVPATNLLNIEITLNCLQNEIATIHLFNVNGELISSSQFTIENDKTLIGFDCSRIPPGTYFVSCVTNEFVKTKKFIKL